MGQYYNAFGRREDGTTFNLCTRRLPKLMEHAYWRNPLCNTVAKELSQSPARLWWVGNYAYESEVYKDCQEAEGATDILVDPRFRLDKKYIVNLTRKQFLDCCKFSAMSSLTDDWSLHPLPLLTAQGNGKGDGDYFDVNADKIGIWAGDLLTIEPESELSKYKGFEEFEILFSENW